MNSKVIEAHIQNNIIVKEAVLKQCIPSIEEAAEAIVSAVNSGNKILFFGNGGSASDSQHLAAEFVGRYETERRPLPAIALTTDTSIITAVANDYGYDTIFERQIIALGVSGDVAVGISTSGNSANVNLAIIAAKKQGLKTIGFSGNDGGELAKLVDTSINIPSNTTAHIQEAHIMVGHVLCKLVDLSQII
ncbi:MAG: D-sedoheptulose 7-phosphate isomerase [Candidatus Omnitrophota bacterium]